MAHDGKTLQLLTTLGVLSKGETRALFYNLLSLFSQRKASDINRELSEIIILREKIKQQVSEQFQLAKDPKQRPIFVEYWDSEYLCYTIKASIAENSTDNLQGREVIIRISHRSSNNNFGEHDVLRMLESKYNAAIAASPKNLTYLDAIKQAYQEFLRKIKEEHDWSSEEDLDEARKNNILLQRKFIAVLSFELAKSYLKSGQTLNNKAIIEQVNRIKNIEIDLISSTLRPIVINVYPLESNVPNQSSWVYNTNIPRSDISSNLRTFQTRDLSNYWEVHNSAICISHNQEQAINISPKEQFSRSSSFAMLEEYIDEEQDEDDIDAAEGTRVLAKSASTKSLVKDHKPKMSQHEIEKIEYEALVKYVKQIIIRMLVAKFAAGEPIENPGQLNLSFTTLLSPIIAKPHEIFAKFTPDVFGRGNERSQLESMRKLFDKLDGEKIGLTPDDIKEIYARLKKSKIELSSEQKREIHKYKAHANTVYINLPVNKFGKISMENLEALTLSKFNHVHNEAGMKKYRAHIVKFLESNYTAEEIIAIKELFALPYNESNWREIKHLMLKSKDSLTGNISKERRETLRLLLSYYVNIQDYLYKEDSQVAENKRIANGYLIASASIATLNMMLGFETHVTCKSGKDRTGLYSAFREALLENGSEELLIKNICNVLTFSALKDLNEYNAPGCRGLQVDEDILDGLDYYFNIKLLGDHSEIKEIIKLNRLRKMGAMNKEVWKCSDEINQILKLLPAQSSSQSIINLISQGIISSTALLKKSPAAGIINQPIVKKPESSVTTHHPKLPQTPPVQITTAPETVHLKPTPAKVTQTSTSNNEITNALKGLKHVNRTASVNTSTPETQPSSFAEIRAKFEQNKKKNNPPPTPSSKF